MKIAFDVDVLAKQMDINRMVHQVADWGYKYIEQSPHPRINPFYKHPLFSKECEAEYRKALRETGVEISSFIVVKAIAGLNMPMLVEAFLTREGSTVEELCDRCKQAGVQNQVLVHEKYQELTQSMTQDDDDDF